MTRIAHVIATTGMVLSILAGVSPAHAEGPQSFREAINSGMPPVQLQRSFPVQVDWILQDSRQSIEAWLKAGGRADRALVDKVIEELRRKDAALTRRYETLSATENADWLDLYLTAGQLRRAQRLETLTRQTNRIVFTKHYNLGGSHYAYTEGLSDAQGERHFRPGSALCLLTVTGADAQVVTLLEDKEGPKCQLNEVGRV